MPISKNSWLKNSFVADTHMKKKKQFYSLSKHFEIRVLKSPMHERVNKDPDTAPIPQHLPVLGSMRWGRLNNSDQQNLFKAVLQGFWAQGPSQNLSI